MSDVTLKVVSADFLADLRERQAAPPEVVETPWPMWNRACRDEGGGRGPAMGWYIVLAGPTGHGKTLLGLNLTASALRQGVSVAFFTLEMSEDQLQTRLRSIVSGEDITRLEWGPRFDADAAAEADRMFMEMPGSLYRNDEPIWRLEDIRQEMARLKREGGVGLAIVDYAQLVEPAGDTKHLFAKMSEISAQLRYSAKHLGMVTVALSQLNREATRDRGMRATVDGLFGSSRFGHDADQVAILDHTRRATDDVERVTRTWVNLAKNRHGPNTEIPVALEKDTLRFREAKDDEAGDWPGVER